jgi:hypothetical protein
VRIAGIHESWRDVWPVGSAQIAMRQAQAKAYAMDRVKKENEQVDDFGTL